jgi:hypothetical protein
VHPTENAGERRFGQIPFHGSAGRGKNLFQSLADTLANRAVIIRCAARHSKRLFAFDRAKHFREVYRARCTAQPRAEARPFPRFDEFGSLESQQKPANYHRIGVNACGQHRRRRAVSLSMGKHRQDVHGHGKATIGSHTDVLYVTQLVTDVK